MHRVEVDPQRIVVELEAARELASHADRVFRRKPPWYS